MAAPISTLDPRPAPPTGPPPPRPRSAAMRVFGGLAIAFALVTVSWGCFSLIDSLAIRTYRSTTTLPIAHRIDLQAGDADVTIVPDASNQIVVDRTVRRGLQRADAQAFERDGALIIDGGCHGPFGWTCSVSITIHVPVDVDVVGSVGDGNMSDRGTHGLVQVTSSDGDIYLDHVEGAVRLQTADGNVQVYGLVAPDVQASSGDGDMDVELASSPDSITVHSGDGDVDVCLPRATPPYAVTTRQGDGSLDNQLPTDPGADRRLIVTTGDGDALLHFC
jgi:Putative adhesin